MESWLTTCWTILILQLGVILCGFDDLVDCRDDEIGTVDHNEVTPVLRILFFGRKRLTKDNERFVTKGVLGKFITSLGRSES